MKYLFLVLVFILGSVHAEIKIVKIGNQRIQLISIPGHGKTLIHLHENETTALRAAKRYIRTHGASLIRLKHGGTRNIRFRLKKKYYEFDPNRIFTDKGIKNTLQEFGSYSHEAYFEVKKLSRAILKQLPHGKIIAVHNNRHYSLNDYLPHHKLAVNVNRMHVNARYGHRNFYLVTNKNDYLRLSKRDFNVVLQKRTALDDGSLSYYLANKQYINIESAYSQLSIQVNMLNFA